ncbi:MAG: hypothetical protein ACOC23_04440 [Thermodesulfobacteriota bacterium]
MKITDTKLEAVLGFWTGFTVCMLFVADIWSGTAGSMPILGALPAAILLLAASIRNTLHSIPEPVPVQRRTASRNQSSGLR